MVDAGFPKEDVKLVIVRNLASDEDHAMDRARQLLAGIGTGQGRWARNATLHP
jgi:hypothetical protein